ncbi:MAG: glutamate 5-kinase, partial [Ruminococcus sp.]|nr:glutamate 5-kinase [Candidatus Copronaster equi]
VLSDLKNAGNDIILVSSAAIGMGVGKLKLKSKPSELSSKQAAAAVGQCELMYTYDKLFSEYNHIVAQLLMTGADFENEERHQNFQNTMEKLLEFSAIPIINENDTVATKEIEVGDNDTLSALVADSVKADLLIILSDIDGLFDDNPRTNSNAKLIPVVEKIDEKIWNIAGNAGSSMGTGGMRTKINAAEISTKSGCDMIIANGTDPDILYDIMDDNFVGTKFLKKQVL